MPESGFPAFRKMKICYYYIPEAMSRNIPKNQQDVLEFAKQGSLVDGNLALEPLWIIDENDKFRYWQIFIGIKNPTTGKRIVVTQSHINRKELPEGYQGAYWSIYGLEGSENIQKSEITFVVEGKSKGRSNFTTPFTQAILDARTVYNKRVRKGAQSDKSLLKRKGETYTMEELIKSKHRGDTPWRVFAMALHDVTKSNNWRHIEFPCDIQPKLDGTLFIVVMHPSLPLKKLKTEKGEIEVPIDGYSRGREEYEGHDHVLAELAGILKKYPGLHIVGELWKEGYGLQDISGSSRRQETKTPGKRAEAIKLDFNAFDCFYIDKPELTWAERKELLQEVIDDNAVYTKMIESTEIENKEEAKKIYEEYLKKGLEGAVIRNIGSLYEFNVDRERRSYQTLKWKPRPDGEWPVVGFAHGKGKEEKAVKWVCAENDEGAKKRNPDGELPPIAERKTFNVTPNQPTPLRIHIFAKLQEDPEFFETHIKGKLLTIGYSILSKDFLPQQPKGLRFRDIKIDKLLLEGYEGAAEMGEEEISDPEDDA